MNRRQFFGSLFRSVAAVGAMAYAPGALTANPKIPGGTWVPVQDWLDRPAPSFTTWEKGGNIACDDVLTTADIKRHLDLARKQLLRTTCG